MNQLITVQKNSWMDVFEENCSVKSLQALQRVVPEPILPFGNKIEQDMPTDSIFRGISPHDIADIEMLMRRDSLRSSAGVFEPTRRYGNIPLDEHCVICGDQLYEISTFGYLDKCQHIFCFECIKKWADMANLCPLCKRAFPSIRKLTKSRLRRKSFEAEIVHVQPKQLQPDFDYSLNEGNNQSGCEICHEDNDWPNMLLCDICDNGYHTFCLNPPLSHIPSGNWFCPLCRNTVVSSISIMDDSERNSRERLDASTASCTPGQEDEIQQSLTHRAPSSERLGYMRKRKARRNLMTAFSGVLHAEYRARSCRRRIINNTRRCMQKNRKRQVLRSMNSTFLQTSFTTDSLSRINTVRDFVVPDTFVTYESDIDSQDASTVCSGGTANLNQQHITKNKKRRLRKMRRSDSSIESAFVIPEDENLRNRYTKDLQIDKDDAEDIEFCEPIDSSINAGNILPTRTRSGGRSLSFQERMLDLPISTILHHDKLHNRQDHTTESLCF